MILGTGTHERSEAFDGFEVMIEDVWASIHDHLQGPVAIIEIGYEHLDDDAGVDGADGLDGFLEMLGTSITEVIAGHCGDDDVAQFHASGGLGDAERLVFFQGVRLGGFDGAKSAGTGAFFASYHESGCALTPAFPAVRALSFFADGDEFEICDQ